MKTEKILLTTGILAAAALPALRLVTYAGGVPAAGALCLGVANTSYDAGEQAAINTHGELLCEAGGTVAVGAKLQSDASGRVITWASGEVVGYARDAGVVGEFIRIMR